MLSFIAVEVYTIVPNTTAPWRQTEVIPQLPKRSVFTLATSSLWTLCLFAELQEQYERLFMFG
jgi:hypothetical protein